MFATGYLALTPTQAAGAPAGRMSAALSHGNEHYRYSAPYWGSSYSGYAGIYDSDYSYTLTPGQQATAKQRVEDYLAAVKKDRKSCGHPSLYFGGNAQADKKTARRLFPKAATAAYGGTVATALFDGL